MGLLNWLGIGTAIAKPIDAVSKLYTTDKDRLHGEKELEEVVQKPILTQMATNAILASSKRLFDSGWQPLIGWTCGFLVLLYYAPQIVVATYVWSKHCMAIGNVVPFPIKPDDILNLIYLLFGFGSMQIAKKKIVGD